MNYFREAEMDRHGGRDVADRRKAAEAQMRAVRERRAESRRTFNAGFRQAFDAAKTCTPTAADHLEAARVLCGEGSDLT